MPDTPGMGDNHPTPGPLGPAQKRMQYIAGVVILASCTLAAVVVGNGWSWPLFLWGAVVGFVAGPLQRVVTVYAAHRAGVPEAVMAEREAAFRDRNRHGGHLTAMIGVSSGIFSAGTGIWALNLFLTVLLALSVLMLLLLGPRLARRAREGQA